MTKPAAQSDTEFPGGAKALAGVSVVLAQQAAMEGPVQHLSHGTRLFMVASGWQAQAIAADAGTLTCTNLRELDAAMQDETKRVIFLPQRAMMTAEDIEKVCRRHGATKTLFWEDKGA